jgi:GTPase
VSEQAKRRERAARATRVSASNPEGLPTVAIVGRPNVGKSTLVNRIIGRREAIVEERPGVTRDRKELRAEWSGADFMVVDTGGWVPSGTALDQKVSKQSERAVEDADVAIMVVDVTTGPTVEDESFADVLRRRRTKGTSFVAVNKVDGSTRDSDIWVFMSLGLGTPFAVSALHGRQVGDLLDEVIAVLPPPEKPAGTGSREDGDFDFERAADEANFGEVGLGGGKVPGSATAGRHNISKSTLFNRLIGDERSVVHDMAGTTRDSIDTVVETEHGTVRFVDTAGMRRRSRVDEDTEYFSVLRALDSIDEADAALLVIDSSEGVTGQDQRLAERIDGAGCPIVIVLNKWETVSAEQRKDVLDQVEDKLGFIGYAPVMKISALTGLGVAKLLPTLAESVTAYHRRVPTRALNQLIADAQAAHPNREARVLYATQGATDPPTFTLFANRQLSPPYLRYLERKIREHFGFGATPLKLRVRKRGS